MVSAIKKRTYIDKLSEEQKEQIINEFLPFIKYTAYRLSWRLPAQLTVEDLISVGLMGLIEVLNKYDEERGKLRTYAEHRIKGAMLDELRCFDNISRSLREKVNELKNTYSMLEKKLGRTPEDQEVANMLDITIDEYYRILQSANGAMTLSLEDFNTRLSDEDDLNILDSIADPKARNPLNALEDSDMKEILARFIDELPEKEKLVLSLYYWEELTMKEIGKVMDLTEGRVCQLHNQALLRLKGKLKNFMEDTE
jgi:RNA polymerase sigma factor for flagellar operon FliA